MLLLTAGVKVVPFNEKKAGLKSQMCLVLVFKKVMVWYGYYLNKHNDSTKNWDAGDPLELKLSIWRICNVHCISTGIHNTPAKAFADHALLSGAFGRGKETTGLAMVS